jgi:hypothetical protein
LKEIQRSLLGRTTSFILMNKFYNEKLYANVVDLFICYMNDLLAKAEVELKQAQKYRSNRQKQLIPFGHLRLVTAALLCMVHFNYFKKKFNLLILNNIKST